MGPAEQRTETPLHTGYAGPVIQVAAQSSETPSPPERSGPKRSSRAPAPGARPCTRPQRRTLPRPTQVEVGASSRRPSGSEARRSRMSSAGARPSRGGRMRRRGRRRGCGSSGLMMIEHASSACEHLRSHPRATTPGHGTGFPSFPGISTPVRREPRWSHAHDGRVLPTPGGGACGPARHRRARATLRR
jgi:hypothetical protein